MKRMGWLTLALGAWAATAAALPVVTGKPYKPEEGPPKGLQLVAVENGGLPGETPHKVRGRGVRVQAEGTGGVSRAYDVADNWDRAVVYRYEGLDPRATYRLRVSLPPGGHWLYVLANRQWLYIDAKVAFAYTLAMQKERYAHFEFDLAPDMVRDGVLELRFTNSDGHAAQISRVELWADRAMTLPPCNLPPVIRSHRDLAVSPWTIAHLEKRPFFFKCYDKIGYHRRHSIHGRFAYETKVQGLLDPVWEWTDTALGDESRGTGIAEWGYNRAADGETKVDCFNSRRQYFMHNLEVARREGKTFGSFTGHGWLEGYAALWGADMLVTEFGAGSPCVQARMALARGAARQAGIPFATQTSPWYRGLPVFDDGEGDLQQQHGHSAWFQARTWYLSWLGGASFACPEACQVSFFQRPPELKGKPCTAAFIDDKIPDDTRLKLSPVGVKAKQFVSMINAHRDVGIPYTPFAVIMDLYAGFQVMPGAGRVYPWWRLNPTPGDMEIARFLDTVFPGSVIYKQGDKFSESRMMVNTPYGDSFDLLMSNVRLELLRLYPVAIVVGDHELSPAFRQTLLTYLKGGGHVVMNQRLAGQLGSDLEAFRRAGRFWIEEFVRDAQDVRALMDRLAPAYLPLAVEGDIEYTVNRTATGWLVGLVDNKGAWREEEGPVIFKQGPRVIRLQLNQGTVASAREWCESKAVPAVGNTLTVPVPPGDVRIVEITLAKP